MATNRRDYGHGSIRNRGTERKPRWQVLWPVKVPTYAVRYRELVDGEWLERSRDFDRLEQAERFQRLRGGSIEVTGTRAAQRSKTFPAGVRKADAADWLAQQIKGDGTA